jgi:hypothetical protein
VGVGTAWSGAVAERHTHVVAALTQVLASGLLLVVVTGCGSDDRERSDTGTVVVTVTLSRSGPPGPSIDHVPQRDQQVDVVEGTKTRYSGRTDQAGIARVPVPVGDYDVDVAGCPNAPQHVVVTKDSQVPVEFDCVAA